jgi:membrane glycosyltransferase
MFFSSRSAADEWVMGGIVEWAGGKKMFPTCCKKQQITSFNKFFLLVFLVNLFVFAKNSHHKLLNATGHSSLNADFLILCSAVHTKPSKLKG